MSVSLSCLVCLIIASLFSTKFVMAFASHDHDSIVVCPLTQDPICACDNMEGCPRTLAPMCACDNDDSVASVYAGTYTKFGNQLHTYDDYKTSCMTCALIHKIVNPLRYVYFGVSTGFHADVCLSTQISVFSFVLLPDSPSLVELKTKITN